MDKKKGSAMVLAILLLAFFMALSLNMWFISQKKAQRAGDKIIGNSVLTDIDGSSTLGYYEFFLATEYMTKGFVTTGTYTPSTTIYGIGGVPNTTTIEGIILANEKQYFGSYLTTSGALTTSANAILDANTVSALGVVISREWTPTGGAIIGELWDASDWTNQESFGRYKISTPVLVDGVGVSTSTELSTRLNTNPLISKKIETNYVKNISLTASDSNKNEETSYIITAKRISNVTLSGTAIQFESDQISEITITKQ